MVCLYLKNFNARKKSCLIPFFVVVYLNNFIYWKKFFCLRFFFMILSWYLNFNGKKFYLSLFPLHDQCLDIVGNGWIHSCSFACVLLAGCRGY